MNNGLSNEQNISITTTTLSNAVELAAGIAITVLNEEFYNGNTLTPTLDVVRQACLDRIEKNHNLL